MLYIFEAVIRILLTCVQSISDSIRYQRQSKKFYIYRTISPILALFGKTFAYSMHAFIGRPMHSIPDSLALPLILTFIVFENSIKRRLDFGVDIVGQYSHTIGISLDRLPTVRLTFYRTIKRNKNTSFIEFSSNNRLIACFSIRLIKKIL